MKIVFFGTPDFAVASLEAMLGNHFDVVAVVTAPDKPAGRGQKLQASPVKDCAVKHGIPVLQPINLKDEAFHAELRRFNADLQIVVAFRMLPEIVWDMPRLGTYNVHASLLPDYRGAAPINWAIINGEKETGVTTFKLKHEIDTGSILLQKKVELGKNETAGTLYERLMKVGAELLIESLHMLQSNDPALIPQSDNGTTKHAPKIHKSDCKINVKQPAKRVHDFIRGMTPFPGAYLLVSIDNEEIEQWKIASAEPTDQRVKPNSTDLVIEGKSILLKTEDLYISLKEIQAPGKKKMDAVSFLNGFRGNIASITVK